jgi:hypothetical protein
MIEGAVLVQRLLRYTCVPRGGLKTVFRRRDLIGAEQVHEDTSVEIVQLAEFQHPCFLGQNVRPSFFTVLSVTTFWSFLREFSPLSRARF